MQELLDGLNFKKEKINSHISEIRKINHAVNSRSLTLSSAHRKASMLPSLPSTDTTTHPKFPAIILSGSLTLAMIDPSLLSYLSSVIDH